MADTEPVPAVVLGDDASGTRLIAVRHGETDWNRERRMQGQTDSVLSELGWRQARALGRRLAGVPFAALYSSDLKRAYDTARCVADLSGHQIVTEPDLRERTFGIFEGLTWDEIKSRFPQEYQRFRSLDPDYVIPDGESARAFFQRSIACLERIARAHPGATVVAVCHGLLLDSLYRAAHAMPLDARRSVDLFNASLNTFHYSASVWRMESWGDVEHLNENASVYVGD